MGLLMAPKGDLLGQPAQDPGRGWQRASSRDSLVHRQHTHTQVAIDPCSAARHFPLWRGCRVTHQVSGDGGGDECVGSADQGPAEEQHGCGKQREIQRRMESLGRASPAQ